MEGQRRWVHALKSLMHNIQIHSNLRFSPKGTTMQNTRLHRVENTLRVYNLAKQNIGASEKDTKCEDTGLGATSSLETRQRLRDRSELHIAYWNERASYAVHE